jgi:hypothetical protein
MICAGLAAVYEAVLWDQPANRVNEMLKGTTNMFASNDPTRQVVDLNFSTTSIKPNRCLSWEIYFPLTMDLGSNSR